MDQRTNGSTGWTFGQVFLTFLAGTTAGATAALLLAPRSGEETRNELRRLAGTSSERVKKLPEALVEATEAAASAFTDALNQQMCGKEAGHS